MLLNERILDEIQMIEEDKTKLPAGILARVRRTICELGKKNANNRVYEKELWEKVLSDENFKKKLANRQILGEAEHPTGEGASQIKYNPFGTSHIISNMFIDEASNTVKADFDIIPSEAGKFIYILHCAGVKVSASTRADGSLEEKVDESGNKYSRVIPEEYVFQTVDHTGDASCGATEPENIIRAVESHYNSKDINKNLAVALLETVKTDASKKLIEIIKQDKQHDGCNCAIGDKKCGSCNHVEEDKKANEEPLLKAEIPVGEQIKVGDAVKVNEQTGLISHIFNSTKKAIIQFANTKEVVDWFKCKLVTEKKSDDWKAENELTEQQKKSIGIFTPRFNKDKNIWEYKIDKQIVVVKEAAPVAPPVKLEVNIDKQVEEFLTANRESFKDDEEAKASLIKVFNIVPEKATEYVKQMLKGETPMDVKTKVVDESKKYWECPKCKSKLTSGSMDPNDKTTCSDCDVKMVLKNTTKKDKGVNETIYSEYPEWKEIIDIAKEKKAEGMDFKKITIFIKDIGYYKKWLFQNYHGNDFDLMGEIEATLTNRMANESKVNEVKDGRYWIKPNKNSDHKEVNYVKNINGKLVAGNGGPNGENFDARFEITPDMIVDVYESKDEIKDLYINEIIHLSEGLREQEEVFHLIAEMFKLQKKYSKEDIITALKDYIHDQEVMVTEAKEKWASYKQLAEKHLNENNDLLIVKKQLEEEIKSYKMSPEEVKKLEKQLEEDEKRIKSLEAEKEVMERKNLELSEAHASELVKLYANTRVKVLGLKIPKQFNSILEACEDFEEVDKTIREIQEGIREGIVNKVNLSEIVVAVEKKSDSKQDVLDDKVANVFKGMGM
jgi:hypothetical protein